MAPLVDDRRAARIAAVAIVLFAMAYLALARFGLDAYPVSGDEYSYRLQGEIFAHGHMRVPAPAHRELFQVDHVVMDDAGVRSKYPPAWPALLALGWLVGAPWIVCPLLGAGLLALLFGATRRILGGEAALVATLLLGASPFFALQAASFHSHVPTLFALAAYFYGLVRGAPERRLGWAVLAGAALGVAFLMRPLDAMIYALALLVFVRSSPRFAVACGLAAACVGALVLPYQAAQFGSPWISGYQASDAMTRELYGNVPFFAILSPRNLIDPPTQWEHAKWLVDLGARLAPGTLLLGIVGFVRPPDALGTRPWRRFLLVVFAIQLVLFLAMFDDYGDGYGPRYLSPWIVPLAVGAGAGWLRARAWIGEAWRARSFALVLAAMVGIGLVRVGVVLEPHREDTRRRSGLYTAIARANVGRAVVIVQAEYPSRFTRNGIDFRAPVLYVASRGRSDDEIASVFPDRALYSAEAPRFGAFDWKVTRLR